jgi:hypothetical protein
LDITVPKAIVKITATDTAGNSGEKTASFTLAPVITMASYNKPILTLLGMGFNGLGGSTPSFFGLQINGRDITRNVTINSNSSITVKGNKRKLGLVRGNNTVKIFVNSVESNSSAFTF